MDLSVIITVHCLTFSPSFSCFLPSFIPPSLALSLSLTVRQVCVSSLAPAVTLPLVFSSLHLPLSRSSGTFLWANRKPRRLVMRPPVPAPPTVFLSTNGNTSPLQTFASTHTYPTSASHLVLPSSCYKFAYNFLSYPSVHPLLLSVPVTPWLELGRWGEMSPHFSLMASMEWIQHKYILTVLHDVVWSFV